jgi:threonine/homoserine/homoserine lactone efflux protein
MFEPTLWHGLVLLVPAVLVLNATPGVDMLLTVTRTAQSGARAGAMAALGISSGVAVHVLAAAFGLSALLAASEHAFTVIKWLGAAYLVWLGVGMLRSAWRARAAQAARDTVGVTPAAGAPTAVGAWADFRRGLFTNLLNPKVALFMLAFLPQFVPAQTVHKQAAFLALGTVAVGQGLLFLLGVVVVTRKVARSTRWASLRGVLNALGGLIFLTLAARLAATPLEAR